MSKIQLEAQVRTKKGKAANQSLRKQGDIPAILYGNRGNILIEMPEEETRHILEKMSGMHELVPINVSDSEPVETVLKMSDGGVEFSFEALGRKETAEQCFEMLCPGGVATVIGMIPEGQKVEVLGSELLSEKTLQGSNMGSNQFRIDMPYYVDLYLEGKLKLDLIHERNIELENINESFQLLRNGNSGRHTVIFNN